MTATAAVRIDAPPRSSHFAGKILSTERRVNLRGTLYHERVFADDSAELARYDEKSGKWVLLCFPSVENPSRIGKIKEAVKYNFNPRI